MRTLSAFSIALLLIGACAYWWFPKPLTFAPMSEQEVCPGVLMVTDPEAAVHVRPTRFSRQIKRDLNVGQLMHVCGRMGDWFGVLIFPAGDQTCIDRSDPSRERVSGECASGWINASLVTYAAG